jgi:hypothetical protein
MPRGYGGKSQGDVAARSAEPSLDNHRATAHWPLSARAGGLRWRRRAIAPAAGRGLPSRRRSCRMTTVLTTTRDDSGTLNHHRYSTRTSLSCLVTAPACSWQCGDQSSSSIFSLVQARARRPSCSESKRHRLFIANDREPTGKVGNSSVPPQREVRCRTRKDRRYQAPSRQPAR